MIMVDNFTLFWLVRNDEICIDFMCFNSLIQFSSRFHAKCGMIRSTTRLRQEDGAVCAERYLILGNITCELDFKTGNTTW